MSVTSSQLRISDLRASLPGFCRNHGIQKLELFGSAAIGEARDNSDLDFLVTFLPGKRLGLDFFAVQDELEALTGRRVDLLTRRSAEADPNPIRRRSILDSAIEIYAA